MSERETMTVGEFGNRAKALADKLDARYSKATMLLMLAYDAVWDTWWRGGAATLDEAEAQLLERLDRWSKNGRMRNVGKRTDAMIRRFDEVNRAIAEGRPIPRKKPKRRKRRTAR